MSRSLHFNTSWLYQESADIGATAGTGAVSGSPVAAVAPFKPANPASRTAPPAGTSAPEPDAADVAQRAEQAMVSELLQIARAVLTLEITFEAGPRRAPEAAQPPVPDGAALLDRPVVLRDGEVYGTLCCVSDDRRTPVGSRPADALRCVAVLMGKELDRHRRRSGSPVQPMRPVA